MASDGRRLGRGTNRGTAAREIPVLSALQVRSAAASVQVMQSVQGSMPLVKRRLPLLATRHRTAQRLFLQKNDALGPALKPVFPEVLPRWYRCVLRQL